jgi:hypothetical protein
VSNIEGRSQAVVVGVSLPRALRRVEMPRKRRQHECAIGTEVAKYARQQLAWIVSEMPKTRKRRMEIDQAAARDLQAIQQFLDGTHGLRASAYKNQQ